jgi:hypothetical protein
VLCEHGRADLGDYFVDRRPRLVTHSVGRATWRSRSPRWSWEDTGHEGPCDHRDSRSSPCRKDQPCPPSARVPAACLPGYR